MYVLVVILIVVERKHLVPFSFAGTVLRAKGFDTHGNSSAGNHLRDFLNGIKGKYVPCLKL